MERWKASSDSLNCEGSPLNSVLMTGISSREASSMTRVKLRTAARRPASSGPEMRWTGRMAGIVTPASAARFLNFSA